MNGCGYKDPSLSAGLLRAVYTTQVYTYNHGAELKLQNGQAK